MSATASLRTGNKTIELPVVVGTEDEHAIDISSLRAQTGHHNRRGVRQHRLMPQCHHLPPLVAMLEKIVESKISVKDYVAQVKHKKQQH